MKCYEICVNLSKKRTWLKPSIEPNPSLASGFLLAGYPLQGRFGVLIGSISKEGLVNCAKIRLNSLNIHPLDPDSFLE